MRLSCGSLLSFADLIKLVPTLPNAQPAAPVDHYSTIPVKNYNQDIPIYHQHQQQKPQATLTPTMQRRVILPDQPATNLTPTMSRRVIVPQPAANLTPTMSRRVMVPQQPESPVFNYNKVSTL